MCPFVACGFVIGSADKAVRLEELRLRELAMIIFRAQDSIWF